MVSQSINDKTKKYFPLFFLFFYLFFQQIYGYGAFFAFTTTSHIAITASLACIVFVSVIICGLANNGLKYFLHFNPGGSRTYAYLNATH